MRLTPALARALFGALGKKPHVAAAVVRVLQSDDTTGRVFTLSHPRPLTVRDCVTTIRKEYGSPVRVIYVPYFIAWLGGQLLNVLHKVTGKGPSLNFTQWRFAVFRRILQHVLPHNVIEFVRTLRWLTGQIGWLSRATGRNEENILKLYKMLLSQQTKNSHQLFAAHSLINNYEMKFYSQNGEDGILLYLFSLIGTKNRKFVEIGCGNGLECCSANLSLNFGWSGLLVDCNETNIAIAKDAYGKLLGHTATKVQIVQKWVDKDNINDLLENYSITGEIDLLIIDIDGNDYWI